MPQPVRILIADRLAEAALAQLAGQSGIEVHTHLDQNEEQLCRLVPDFDGMIIRSGVQITAKVLAQPGRLRAIARAGVGVDNVDLDAATAAGVLVMNTPDANTISTAELTMGLLLALARKIPYADGLVHHNDFKTGRKTGVGTQLAGKTLGIIGVGRIGRAVARRALAFEMNLLGYDPFFKGESLLDGQLKMLPTLEELLPRIDFLTIHTPLTDQTAGTINPQRIELLKPTAMLVNAARGGLYDELAVAEALNRGRIAGAAFDVFTTEPPPPDHPLLTAKNAVLTPHLGASTHEAQLAVSCEAVDAMLDYLLHDRIRGAVNIAGLPTSYSARDRREIDLVTRLARIARPLAVSGLSRITLRTSSASPEMAQALLRFALIELLRNAMDTAPNLINVERLASEYGIAFSSSAQEAALAGPEKLTLDVQYAGGEVSVEGAVYHGVDDLPRLLNISGYRMDLVPVGHMLLVFNHDRPGVVGRVGMLLGELGVNIADMALSRLADKAMMALKLDAALPPPALNALCSLEPVRHAHQVCLPPLMDH